MISDWTRRIWHPTYGWYGGASKKWCEYEVLPAPIDQQDEGFLYHDMWMWLSNFQTTNERRLMRDLADKELGDWLRNITTPYYHQIYGPAYNRGSRIVFRP